MKKISKRMITMFIVGAVCMSTTAVSYAAEYDSNSKNYNISQNVEETIESVDGELNGQAYFQDEERVLYFAYMTTDVVKYRTGNYYVVWTPVPVGLTIYNVTGYLEVTDDDGNWLYSQALSGVGGATMRFSVPTECHELTVEITDITYETNKQEITTGDYKHTFDI